MAKNLILENLSKFFGLKYLSGLVAFRGAWEKIVESMNFSDRLNGLVLYIQPIYGVVYKKCKLNV